MYNVSSLGSEFQLTRHQVRHRIDALKDLLADELVKDDNNTLLLTEDGFEIFRRFRKYEANGLSGPQAYRLLQQTLGKKSSQPLHNNAPGPKEEDETKESEREREQFRQQQLKLLNKIRRLEEELEDKKMENRILRERLDKHNGSTSRRGFFGVFRSFVSRNHS